MNYMSLAFILYSLLALVLLKITAVATYRISNRRKATRLGCETPVTVRGKWFGVSLLIESVKATKDEWGPIWMHKQFQNLGGHVHTIRAPVFDYELLITRDVENVKAMFASQSQDFDIGFHREKTFLSLLGPGVMTGRGDKWKHSRSLIRPQFARDNVSDLAMLQRHTDALIKRLQVDASGWTTKVDLGPMFYEFTLDTSTEFLLGQSVHIQDPEARAHLALSWDKNAPDPAEFGYHLDGAKHMLDRRGALTKYGWLIRDGTYPEHCRAVQGFVDYFVHQRLSRTDDEKIIETASGKEKFVLLDELAKETQNPLELRNELLNVLHASRDTTAALMGWLVYFLSRHRDVQTKLREEVSKTFGSSPTSEITFTALLACQYIQWVVLETVRMVGVVPMNERMAIRDTTLPRGGGPDGQSPVFVPKGVQVLIPTYSMQHREDVWGPDVEEYKPERWDGRRAGWNFVAWGSGSRQCLGQQFARTEASFVLIRLLQTFDDIENMEAPGPLKMHHTIENRSGTGVQVRLHAAPTMNENVRRVSDSGIDGDIDLGLGVDYGEKS